MLNPFLDIIFQRTPNLHYVSPPVCENDFSSTSYPVISLTPYTKWVWGSGPIWFWENGNRMLWWGTIPGAVCINVYRRVGDTYVLMNECVDPDIPIPVPNGVDPDDIVITVINRNGGESDYSPPPTLAGYCAEIQSLSPVTGSPILLDGNDMLTLSVTATGTPPLRYQFFHDGVLVESTFSNTYSVQMAPELAGLWHVEVSNYIPGCYADVGDDWDIQYDPLDLTTSEIDPACFGEAFSFFMDADGGRKFPSGDYLWTLVNGPLPAGLSLDPDSGEISGTPSEGGSFPITISVTDALGDSVEEDFTIVSVEILTDETLPGATNGEAYSGLLEADPAPITWELTGGALPDGLILNLDGTITGTPTECGDFSFEATATPEGFVTGCAKDFTLRVYEPDSTVMGTVTVLPDNLLRTFTGAGMPLTPGKYQIEYYVTGSPITVAQTNDGVSCYGEIAALGGGGPRSNCPDVPAVYLFPTPPVIGLDDLPGVIGIHAIAATAQSLAENGNLALNPMEEFETTAPLTNLQIRQGTFVVPNAVCGCTTWYNLGGSGNSYRVVRVGKLCGT